MFLIMNSHIVMTILLYILLHGCNRKIYGIAYRVYNADPSDRPGFATVRLLGLRVRIPPGAWVSISCDCCVLSGLCDGLITRPEESY
jgi:hypothetical protein